MLDRDRRRLADLVLDLGCVRGALASLADLDAASAGIGLALAVGPAQLAVGLARVGASSPTPRPPRRPPAPG